MGPSSRRNTWFILLVAIPLISLSSGCLSEPLWNGCYRRDSLHDIPGVIRSPDGKSDQLVISYVADKKPASDRFFVLPLNASGLPDGPFLYRGEQRSLRAIVEELCASDSPMEGIRLKQLDGSAAPAALPAFHAFDVKTSEKGSAAHNWRGFYLAAFRREPGGALQPVQGETIKAKEKYEGDDIRWPADCFIIVLPANQPGPAGERAASCVGATLLLPVDVVVTLAVAPVAITLMLLGYSR